MAEPAVFVLSFTRNPKNVKINIEFSAGIRGFGYL